MLKSMTEDVVAETAWVGNGEDDGEKDEIIFN